MTSEYSVMLEDKANKFNKLDSKFISFISSFKYREWRIPSMIEAEILYRCGYFSTIPNQLSKVSVIDRNSLSNGLNNENYNFDSSSDLYLTPAACIHLYPILENLQLKDEIITTLAQVYRYEDGNFKKNKRQWEFSVREFVSVGTPEYVDYFLEYIQDKLLKYARSIDSSAKIEVANDHFYPTKLNLKKEKYQKQNNLKKELVVELGGKKLSIASFNKHGNHFSKEFNFDQKGEIVTGCVGCGIDRWLELLKNN
ncbi:TPA: hypothetical protein ACISS5_000826 [Streptococcus pyogenes]|uniref:hypothetical protein n=1 Tax=Streptococcus pyogenes TaxID=1314 RepID=UPI00109BCEE6|nr:hypothetical protein [Streptococcus pyogenes]QCK61509.1 hypothetical protein ETT52_08260 [Streptococcus pyogenes]VGQ63963.1 tRNA synthetase [Streptococcus pyogenes]VGQ66837.1 tRNA synthetase [Streptococcus pyogenes]VGT48821.1 tRNA synthetase [Streptococcus pyogenes]VGU74033.1 tRNA synthetase [Streptococcus pyogenes]